MVGPGERPADDADDVGARRGRRNDGDGYASERGNGRA